MTKDEERSLLFEFMFGPYRRLRQILCVAWSIDALLEYAKRQGEVCSFCCITYVGDTTEEERTRDRAALLRRIRRAVKGVKMIRINERGGKNGKTHDHFLSCPWVKTLVMRRAAKGLKVGRVSSDLVEPERGFRARYLWKEFVKRSKFKRIRGQKGGFCTGYWGQPRLADVDVKSKARDCMIAGRESISAGESREVGFQRGVELYNNQPWMNWSVPADERGEAWEGEAVSGDVDFDVGEDELDGGAGREIGAIH